MRRDWTASGETWMKLKRKKNTEMEGADTGDGRKQYAEQLKRKEPPLLGEVGSVWMDGKKKGKVGENFEKRRRRYDVRRGSAYPNRINLQRIPWHVTVVDLSAPNYPNYLYN